MKEQRQTQETILQFPEGPMIGNVNESDTPSIQTNTTNKTNKTGATIPSSKYGGLLDQTGTMRTTNQVPWAISVNTKSFREAVTGKSTGSYSGSEIDTFKSGNTSGKKSIREKELEIENQQLIKKLQEKEEYYQQTLKQVHEGYERQRQEDKQQQEQVKQQIKNIQANEREQAEEMAELRAMILELRMKNKKEREVNETRHNNNQGSTPKRQKKRTIITTPSRQEPNPLTGTTLDEEFPEDTLLLEETMPDEEPHTLEERKELNP
jgi:hypothetical protein